MTFSTMTLLTISLAYLALLFTLAWISDRGLITRRLARHPLTYTLSLGIYVSTWTFYGVTDLAYQYGYGFLTIYLGITGAFLLTPVLLWPMLQVTRRYQLSSLADLFAFRFRSTWAGTLTALLMLIAVLPLLALQIQAVTTSIHILSGKSSQAIALIFCLQIGLFTILFGARHLTTRERHEGLVVAIAAESLIKLMVLLLIGGYILFNLFGGLQGVEQWLLEHPHALQPLHSSLDEGPWRSLLLIFFASAIVMPHMFHMTFTESPNPRSLITASWGLPLLLLLMSLSVPLILWAGLRLNIGTSPEYFALGLGLHENSPWLTLAAFIGGISAASGLIIVMTLALAGMLLNHLVLPLYQPPSHKNIYRWLKWTRRLLIIAIILAGYAIYLMLLNRHDLSNLGIVSFVATLQFLPGALSVLYWKSANHRGFIAGLIVGMGIWAVTLLFPLLGLMQELPLPLLDRVYRIDDHNWHLAAMTAIALNIFVFVLVSRFSAPSAEEHAAADACSINSGHRAPRRELFVRSAQEFATHLAKPLGAKTAQKELNKALQDLHLPFDESRPYALQRLRDRIEANLSGLMGPSVAKDIIETFIPYKNTEERYVTEDIYFIESRLEDYQSRLTGLAAELDTLRRYHRQTLQDLPMGVCSLAEDQEILTWNRAMEELTGINAQQTVGSRLSALSSPWRELLEDFIRAGDEHLYKKRLIDTGQPRWLSLHKAAIAKPLASGGNGLVILVEDLTEYQLLEHKLIHSERLASIGRLAAGVAHEIGNPVTGIACLAQNLREERAGDAEIDETSSQIFEQTQRISRILQSLMSFAHSGSHLQALEAVCLADVADEGIQLLSLNRRSTEVRFANLCDPQHWVEGDPQRLLQVIINLLSNARDASFQSGEIRVLSAAAEDTVDLLVEDEGSGVPKTIMNQLFDPFFTTKEPGKGTGLGLALVYSIVEEHYGQILIESPLDAGQGRGTRIRVTLPRHPAPLVDSIQGH